LQLPQFQFEALYLLLLSFLVRHVVLL